MDEAWKSLRQIRTQQIGRGTTGVVHGPYSKEKILQKVAAIDPSIQDILEDDKTYVLKISNARWGVWSPSITEDMMRKQRDIERCFAERPEFDDAFRKYFILPLGYWWNPRKSLCFEIQEYGGSEVSNFTTKRDWTIQQLYGYFTSIIAILECGFFLIDECGYYISDTKAQNTVIELKAPCRLRLIDLVFVPIDKKPSTFTPTDAAVPGQFFPGHGLPYWRFDHEYISNNHLYHSAINKTFTNPRQKKEFQIRNARAASSNKKIDKKTLVKFILVYSMIFNLMLLLPRYNSIHSDPEIEAFRNRIANLAGMVFTRRLELDWDQVIQSMKHPQSRRSSRSRTWDGPDSSMTPLLPSKKDRTRHSRSSRPLSSWEAKRRPESNKKKEECRERRRYLKWLCDLFYLFGE